MDSPTEKPSSYERRLARRRELYATDPAVREKRLQYAREQYKRVAGDRRMRYHTDAEFRQRCIQCAKDRYARLKEAAAAGPGVCGA